MIVKRKMRDNNGDNGCIITETMDVFVGEEDLSTLLC